MEIEITGKLIVKCLIEFKLNEIRNKLKEMAYEIEILEEMLNFDSTDYDTCLRALRRLG